MADILDIEEGVLKGCTDKCARSVIIPDSVTKIGSYAFSMCSVSSLEIPDGVTNIGSYAFYGCGLESVKIPDSVKRIGDDAFFGCKWLSKVVLGDDFEKVPAGWFNSLNEANPNYEIVCTKDSSTYNAIKLSPKLKAHIKEFAFQVAKEKKIIEVKKVGVEALIKSLIENFEDSSYEILSNTKSESRVLVKIAKNVGIFKLGTDSSKWLPKVQKVIEVFADSTKSGAEIFDEITKLKLSLAEIPKGKAKYIKVKADSNGFLNLFASGSFREINYDNGVKNLELFGVTKIVKNAFANCKSLVSVALPDSVTEIGESAFDECTSLVSVNIPSGITEIGSSTFAYCERLVSVELPNGVTEIGGCAFFCCKSLESVNIPDGVTKIGRCMFEGCKLLKSVEIPKNVTEIGYAAFWECERLKSVVIPSSVTEIGESAFWRCESLTSVEFGGTVAQWEAVEKGNNWNGVGWEEKIPAKCVKCTDGEAEL